MTKQRLSAAECAKIFDFPQGIESKCSPISHFLDLPMEE